ncbi:Protein of unknown function, partial [Gryllus bimaculatus]
VSFTTPFYGAYEVLLRRFRPVGNAKVEREISVLVKKLCNFHKLHLIIVIHAMLHVTFESIVRFNNLRQYHPQFEEFGNTHEKMYGGCL